MTAFRRYLLLALLAACCASFGCSKDSAQHNGVVIYMVRHAEKDPDPEAKDPGLTAEGQQRAQRLADVVEKAGLTTIYVTQTERSRQTAAPTAQRVGITPTVIQMGEDAEAHAQAVAARIRAHDSGGRVLLVGHANTISRIMQNLGIADPPKIADAEFNDFFIVILKENGEATLTKATYGQKAGS